MRLDDDTESQNVEDRRSSGMGGLPIGRGGLGVGTVVLALVAWYFGIDPSVVINGARMLEQQAPVSAPAGKPLASDAREDATAHFVAKVLNDTEKTWRQVFQEAGRTYEEPKLVLFRGATQTACGAGQAAMGPFYCPLDRKVYIDLAFYDELRQRFQAPGDFAEAYVIAHEIGHHVQNLLGISERVHQAQQRASKTQANALSVRLELQADCLAGVWASRADAARKILESGDVDEALRAATAIGDDTLQKQSQGVVVPESFTHGTSAQRVRWFRQGLESGSVAQCDTFQAARL